MEATNGPHYTMEDALNYQREWEEQDRRCKVEGALRTAIDRRARDMGLPVEEIKLSIRLRRRGSAMAEMFVAQFMRQCAANGFVPGPQLNAFSNSAEYQPTDEIRQMAKVAQAEDEGFIAGRGGLGKDANPYEVGSEESQAWAKWWGRGVAAQEHIMRGRGEQARPTGEQPQARRRPREPSEPPAPAEPRALPAPEPSLDQPEMAADDNVVPMKRGRGRPPGAKNKNPRQKTGRVRKRA
jgi:DNA-binding transcriptional MerR regulator